MKLEQLTDTDIVFAFREALVAILPAVVRLECLQDDTQPYDDYDAIAEALWDVLVRRSFRWKYRLPEPPSLPRYGMYDPEAAVGSRVVVEHRSVTATFVEFIGDRSFGPDPFNAVGVISTAAGIERWRLTPEIQFALKLS